jgi:early secretory antigenic target protein ESAT-6
MSAPIGDGQLTVNFHAVQTTSSTITLHANSLVQQLEDLDAQLRPLIESWDSATKDQYYAQQLAWATAMSDIQSILAEIGVKLNQAYEDFLATEIANAAAWENSHGVSALGRMS